MKKLFLVGLPFLFLAAGALAQPLNEQRARKSPDWFRKSLTYQMMPRAMSGTGTLKGAGEQLGRLSEMGVSLVYLLPINAADTDMDRKNWSPRQIKSGFNDPRNPYRAGDYFHLDPEYGTDQDLKDFVDKAHSLGMKVFLDLVFYHCGPSAQVIRQHPEYFQHDEEGNLKTGRWHFPIFDYSRRDTREYIKSIMCYYVADFNVDGFRLDVADAIPLDFWNEARASVDALRPGTVLCAEGQKPENTLNAFDANYSWPVCGPLTAGLDKFFKNGEEFDASTIRKSYEQYMSGAPRGTILWNYMENHDTATDAFDARREKIWGYEASTLGLAIIFALDGVPLIFTGQEACYDKRVSLFGHKDCWIDWEEALSSDNARERVANIKHWADLRKNYSALTDGEMVWLDNDQPKAVCSFVRRDGVSQDVVFIGNFSDKKVKVKLQDGSKYKLDPWGYVFEPR